MTPCSLLVVWEPRDDEVVERPLAQRGIRLLDGVQGCCHQDHGT